MLSLVLFVVWRGSEILKMTSVSVDEDLHGLTVILVAVNQPLATLVDKANTKAVPITAFLHPRRTLSYPSYLRFT